ncbi:hypothetical protein SAVIM40S_05342 [Streptomyces avidinii]
MPGPLLELVQKSCGVGVRELPAPARVLAYGIDQSPSGGLRRVLGRLQRLGGVRQLGLRLVEPEYGGPAPGRRRLGLVGERFHMREGAVPAVGRFGHRGPQVGNRLSVVSGKVQPGCRSRLPGPEQRVPGQLPGDPEPVLRGTEAAERLGVLNRGLLPVVDRAGTVALRPVQRQRGSLQFTGTAHLRTLAQGGVGRLQPRPGLGEGSDALLRGRPILLRRGLPGLRLGEVAQQLLVLRVFAAREAGAAAGGRAGVAPVVVEEHGRRPFGGPGCPQLLLLLVQGAEGLGHIRDDGLVHRRKGLGEGAGEGGLVGTFGQLGLAQLDEQVHEGCVALLPETEQRLVDGPAVGLGLVVDHSPFGDRLDEPVPGQDGAGGVEQAQ